MNAISLISMGVGILQALQGGEQHKPRGLQDIFLEEQIRIDAARGHHYHCCPLTAHDTVELSGEASGKAAHDLGAKLADASFKNVAKFAWQTEEARAANHADPFAAIAQAERNGGGKKLTRALDAYISVMARQAEAQSRMSGGVTSGLA